MNFLAGAKIKMVCVNERHDMKIKNGNVKYPAVVSSGIAFVCMVFFAFALLTNNLIADGTSQKSGMAGLTAVETEVVDGFFIAVTGENLTNNTSPNDLLVFLTWSTNAPTSFVVPAEPEYAYQVELLDSNGVAVQKTELGKKIGEKFFDFSFSAAEKGVKIIHMHASKVGDMTSAPLLFRPKDLFKIEKPGNYKLLIRFQILTFPRTGPGRGEYTNDLIRFPVLVYPLVKTH
jgi:hypothetical protein